MAKGEISTSFVMTIFFADLINDPRPFQMIQGIRACLIRSTFFEVEVYEIYHCVSMERKANRTQKIS